MEKINPIVQEVIDTYNTVTKMTEMFTLNPDKAMRGLLVSGAAGLGKTHAVQKGLKKVIHNVDYVKGSSITAPALFVKLYQNREAGQILVLDDVDIVHKGKGEMNTILDLLKGATEPTKGNRTLEWARAQRNALMVDNDVPQAFNFNGAVIWITNDTLTNIADRAKGHWNAISSRFMQVPAWLNDQEKLMYTLYLVEEVDMLGKDCHAKKGGYTPEIIKTVTEYIRNNYKYMDDVTPRVAVAIADIIDNFPNDWKTYCDVQFVKL